MSRIGASRAVLVLLFAAGLSGCMTTDDKAGPSVSHIAPPAVSETTEYDSSPFCGWHFTRQKGGNKSVAKYGTLKVDSEATTGTCSVEEKDTVCVGFPSGACYQIKTYKELRGMDFIAEGSCRYCYMNSKGGMSCVVYNGATC